MEISLFPWSFKPIIHHEKLRLKTQVSIFVLILFTYHTPIVHVSFLICEVKIIVKIKKELGIGRMRNRRRIEKLKRS